ncbi:MAG: FKBP-type peptidyl-prolyl cis-trans isomerase [Leptothrix sp. (in: b-proteobacteria)]
MQNKVLQLTLSAALLGATTWAAAQAAPAPAQNATPASTDEAAGALREAFTTNKEKISYATGVQAARNLTRNNIPFDPELLMLGIKDVLEGHSPRMHEKEMKVVLQSIQGEIHRNMVGNRAELALKNHTKGAAFVEEYKKKPGVVTLPGNVLYRVLREGHGELPREEDVIQARYRGTTVDGTEFDATENERGAPLQMSQMIMGWRQAIKQMPVGSHWEIVIPPNLAYGERGIGGTIGPGETLIFNVELLNTRHPD